MVTWSISIANEFEVLINDPNSIDCPSKAEIKQQLV